MKPILSPGQERPKEKSRAEGLTFARRMYYPRIAGLGLGFFCVASVFYQQALPWPAWLLLVTHGFVWPHLAFRWARASRNAYDAELRNLLIDSFLGGFWVPLMSFNELPSIIVIFMLSMDNMAAAGFRLWLKGTAAQILGGLAGLALYGFHFWPQSSMWTIMACLPMLTLYPLMIGWVSYRLATQLGRQKREKEQANRELQKANEELSSAYQWMRERRDYLLKDRGQEEIAFVVDREGRIEEFTERAVEVLRKSRAEVVGRPLAEFILPEDREAFQRELRNSWAGIALAIPVTFVGTEAEGKTLYEAKWMRITSPERRALLVIFHKSLFRRALVSESP